MCTNTRYIRNIYTDKMFLVNCGHCPACQQEKAARRANRIRNQVVDGQICLFVTLTYGSKFVPYVRRSELASRPMNVVVYRDYDVQFRRGADVHGSVSFVKKVFKSSPFILERHYEYDDDFSIDCFKPLCINKKRNLYDFDKVGVCYYPDVQDFLKRLRQNLKRNFGFDKQFSYFSCSEYGGDSFRPHYHLLLFIPKESEAAFRSAVDASWLYDDKCALPRRIEVARNPASYLSSYVNCGSDFPSFFKKDCFRQKHSYSLNFGAVLDCFSLRSILLSADRKVMSYYSLRNVGGVKQVVSVPIPKYIINRYFPVCKGFTRIALHTLFGLLQDFNVYKSLQSIPELNITDDDLHKVRVRLNNCYQKYYDETKLSRFHYALDYLRVWRCYDAFVYRCSFDSTFAFRPTDWFDFYDNIDDYLDGIVHSISLDSLPRPFVVERDPNKHIWRVLQTQKYEDIYYKYSKYRHVTNKILLESYNV